MNIMVVNLDKEIFREGSSSLQRLKEYSQLVDKIFVIVWTNKKELPIIFQDKLFIYPTNSFLKIFYFLDTIKLAVKIINNHKIDLIFTQDPFETGLAGWFISKMKKIPLQLQIHTDFLSPYFWRESFVNRFRVLLAKFLIPHAKSLRVVSERIKHSIISNIKYPISKIFVLPIFVDVEKIKNTPVKIDLHKKYSQFDFIVLVASRLTKEKNIALAIKAIPDILKKYSQTGLVIVGKGPEEENLKSLVAKLNLQKNIKFEPWTDEIVSYYKTADLFVLTSNYEGYGMSVVEAVSAGCPIVTTDVGCIGEFIKDQLHGLVVVPGDLKSFELSVLKMMDSVHLRREYRDRAQLVVNRVGSKQKYLENYLLSWRQTIGK